MDVAARESQAGGSKSQALQTTSLRHDAHDNEGESWEDPDTTTRPENLAAVQRSVSAGPKDSTPFALNPVQNTNRSSQIKAAAAGDRPAALGTTLKYDPRALGNALPRPPALAANPAVVTALRKGESPYFRPGGTINSDAWINLMNSVGAKSGGMAAPTGASGLTSATLAKALATYGAAEAAAPKANTGLIRP
jgi:hypothetical protein